MVKMLINYERGTSWITTKGSQWTRNGYSSEYVDPFGDVWLKPFDLTKKIYTTIQDPILYFIDKEGHLENIVEE